MGKLVIWTGAKTYKIKKVVGPVIKQFGVPHKVLVCDGKMPKLEEGDVCVAMGTKALEVLQKAGIVAKNRKVGSYRGEVINVHSGKAKIMMTFDPGIVDIDIVRKPDIEWDIALAIRLLKTGTLEPTVGKYKYVDDFAQTIEAIKKLHEKSGKPVPITCDLETLGLDPFAKDVFIVSISITYKKGQADMMRFKSAIDPTQPGIRTLKGQTFTNQLVNEELRDQIHWLMTAKEISTRGANFKYDILWMSVHWGIDNFSNYKMDTTLVGSLLDENRSNSLNTHAKIYTGMGGYDDTFNNTYDKGRMDLVPDKPLLLYGGGDTDACYRVSSKLKSELTKNKRLTNFYVKLLHPSAKAFRRMEQRGMLVDVDRYEEVRVEVQEEIDRVESEIFGMMNRRILIKYREKLTLGSPKLLGEFLFSQRGMGLKPMLVTEKTKKPSTAMEHFEMLAEVYPNVVPFVDAMRDYNSATKTMSTYIVGFLKHLRPDGKFHPTYMLHRGAYGNDDDESGTVTGRTSAKDPAYQTIPKHTKWAKKLRSVYIPPKGYVIMNVDFSQGELRVAACVANEQNMINAYIKGIDMHLLTGTKLVGITLEEALAMKEAGDPKVKEIRQGGKAGNFGLLYAMSAAGFQDYARKTYGVHLTIAQAHAFRDGFFDLYPGLTSWHDDSKQFAHINEYVTSPLGRYRHLPLINSKDNATRAKQERQAINSPIQATLSDIAQLAMAKLDQRYPQLWQCGMTHDAITFYIPEDEQMEWAIRIKEVMENLPLKKDFGWDHQLQFPVDVEIGVQNLAETEEFEVAA